MKGKKDLKTHIYISSFLDEPYSRVKYQLLDLGGQRSVFEKVAQCNEKYCRKGLMKISIMVYELEPFKDFILASEVKGHFYQFVQN